jgi:tRNA(His) guanylyltransferase
METDVVNNLNYSRIYTMNPDEFESKMRSYETYHNLTVPPDIYPIIRVDGRHFNTSTRKLGFKKPFDRTFAETMQETARGLMVGFGAVYAYTESDEISILLPKESVEFNRSVEKLVSGTAAMASAIFNSVLACKPTDGRSDASPYCLTFDSRIITAPNENVVVDYFSWRASDSAKNCLNSYAHWLQVNDGMTPTHVAKTLDGVPVSVKHEILYKYGINFAELPGWQRNGTGVYIERYQREGLNPKTGEKVLVDRRREVVDEDLPTGDEYRAFVLGLVRGDVNANSI